MIRRTVFAAANESARYAMTGVLWELEADQVRLVATDGRRLAVTAGPATGMAATSTPGQPPVVPTKAMGLLERNLHDDEETVQDLPAAQRCAVSHRAEPGGDLQPAGRGPLSRLPRGLPQEGDGEGALQVGPFQTAVRQAAIMTDEESKRVVVPLRQEQADAGSPGRDGRPFQGRDAGRVRRQDDRHRLQSQVPDRHAPASCEPDHGADPGDDGAARPPPCCVRASEYSYIGDAADMMDKGPEPLEGNSQPPVRRAGGAGARTACAWNRPGKRPPARKQPVKRGSGLAPRRAGGDGRQCRAVAGAGPLPETPTAGEAAPRSCPIPRSPTCAFAAGIMTKDS